MASGVYNHRTPQPTSSHPQSGLAPPSSSLPPSSIQSPAHAQGHHTHGAGPGTPHSHHSHPPLGHVPNHLQSHPQSHVQHTNHVPSPHQVHPPSHTHHPLTHGPPPPVSQAGSNGHHHAAGGTIGIGHHPLAHPHSTQAHGHNAHLSVAHGHLGGPGGGQGQGQGPPQIQGPGQGQGHHAHGSHSRGPSLGGERDREREREGGAHRERERRVDSRERGVDRERERERDRDRERGVPMQQDRDQRERMHAQQQAPLVSDRDRDLRDRDRDHRGGGRGGNVDGMGQIIGFERAAILQQQHQQQQPGGVTHQFRLERERDVGRDRDRGGVDRERERDRDRLGGGEPQIQQMQRDRGGDVRMSDVSERREVELAVRERGMSDRDGRSRDIRDRERIGERERAERERDRERERERVERERDPEPLGRPHSNSNPIYPHFGAGSGAVLSNGGHAGFMGISGPGVTGGTQGAGAGGPVNVNGSAMGGPIPNGVQPATINATPSLNPVRGEVIGRQGTNGLVPDAGRPGVNGVISGLGGPGIGQIGSQVTAVGGQLVTGGTASLGQSVEGGAAAGAFVAIFTARLAENFEVVRQEFDTLNSELGMVRNQRDEFESKVQSQVNELNIIRQALYDLENQHGKVRQGFEEELARVRAELSTARQLVVAQQTQSQNQNQGGGNGGAAGGSGGTRPTSNGGGSSGRERDGPGGSGMGGGPGGPIPSISTIPPQDLASHARSFLLSSNEDQLDSVFYTGPPSRRANEGSVSNRDRREIGEQDRDREGAKELRGSEGERWVLRERERDGEPGDRERCVIGLGSGESQGGERSSRPTSRVWDGNARGFESSAETWQTMERSRDSMRLRDRERDGGERERERDGRQDRERERERDRLVDTRDPKRMRSSGSDQHLSASSVNTLGAGRRERITDPFTGVAVTGPLSPRIAGGLPLANITIGQTPKLPPVPGTTNTGSAAVALAAAVAAGSSAGDPHTHSLVLGNVTGGSGATPSFPDDYDTFALPPEYKVEGQDWVAMFNPKMKKTLKVKLMHTLMHESVVCCVRFSADGKYFATGCNRTAQIYQTETGAKTCVLMDENAVKQGDLYIRSVCFSPDGQFLATGAEDKQIRIWDIAKKRIKSTFDGHQQEIYSLEFSLDGRLIVSGSGDKTARIWDMVTGDCTVLTIHDPAGGPGNVEDEDAMDVDDGPLAVGAVASEGEGSGGSAAGHNPDSGVTSVAISPDSRYVAAGSLDKVVRIWELTSTSAPSTIPNSSPTLMRTGTLVERLRGHRDSVYSVAFTPDGKGLVSGSLDRTLKYWDVSHLGIVPYNAATSLTAPASSAAEGSTNSKPPSGTASPSKKTHTAPSTTPGFIGLAKCTSTFLGHKDYVLSVAISGDGQWVVSGSKDRAVQFWDLGGAGTGPHNGSPSLDLKKGGGVSGVTMVTHEKRERELGAAATAPTCACVLQGHKNSVISIDLSPVGSLLATGSGDWQARIWSYKS